MLSNVLVVGAGQLGKALATACSAIQVGYNCIFIDKSELDIRNERQVLAFFDGLPPIQYCINAAAYTNVDACETNTVENQAVNGAGVANLARACQSKVAYLLHISTDYVFDGSADKPYTEADSVNPLNAYGLAKYRGEQNAFKYCERSIIIRTSWLYGYHGANFIKTILNLAKTNKTLKVVDDQIGSPTYALDLALALFSILKYIDQSRSNLTGVYHYCNRGFVSRYAFAKQICETYCLAPDIVPIKSRDFPTPAQRPLYSVLDTTKIRATFKLEINAWQKSLEKFKTVHTLDSDI